MYTKVAKPRKKICVCGRDTTHTHESRQDYIIHEKDETGFVIFETMMHGYDYEDDHIESFIQEAKLEAPEHRFTYFIIRDTNQDGN